MADIVQKQDEPPEDARAGGSGELAFVLHARSIDGQKKLGTVWTEAGGRRRSSTWQLRCDEGPGMGDDTAPSPLMYFGAAVGF